MNNTIDTLIFKQENNIEAAMRIPVEVINPINNCSHVFTGIWDTGSLHSIISYNIISKLNLKPDSHKKIFLSGVSGDDESLLYKIDFIINNQVVAHDKTVYGSSSVNFDMLIGLDVICKGDFSVSNRDGKPVVCFKCQSDKI